MSAETILAMVAVFTAVSGFIITLLTYFSSARKDTVTALKNDNDKLIKENRELKLDNDVLRQRVYRLEAQLAILESVLRQRGIKIPEVEDQEGGAA